MLAPIDKERPELPEDVCEQVEINIKYDGYIRRQMKQVEQFKKLEQKKIPEDIDYEDVGSLRIEARQKLEAYRPVSIGCMYNLEILEKGCEELGITLNDTQKNQFIQFYEFLVEKNKVMNLTGITEFDEVLVKHFLDSLCCVKAVDMSKVKTVMDIGTGAGFPGVPLKIAFPELEACLLDSLNKRVKFLEETFALLGLENISAIHGRAEEYAKNKAYREKYDLCVSRAVSGLATLSEYCLPYVKVGGLFVSYKSGSVKEEAEAAEKAVKILGGKIRDIQYFDLPGSEISRSLVIIEKVKNTPGKYPRKAGTPLREPLA